MQFTRLEPPEELKSIVECYWIVDGDDPTRVQQKIIPDGFPEIIFHFGDPYRIKLNDHWELQSRSLIAGQITKYFYLENTGVSDMLGIKLKPTALTRLFNVSMDSLSDKVVDLLQLGDDTLSGLDRLVRESGTRNDQISRINRYLGEVRQYPSDPTLERAIESILARYGNCTVGQLCEVTNITERQLQRIFKKHVGLSPKFYSRIVRFSYIFQLVQGKKMSWSDVSLEAGFYDQPHFIKNFKTFTGEDPTDYFFDDSTLANFFMNKV
jgi:AraC-like DNA-binding protein